MESAYVITIPIMVNYFIGKPRYFLFRYRHRAELFDGWLPVCTIFCLLIFFKHVITAIILFISNGRWNDAATHLIQHIAIELVGCAEGGYKYF